MFAGVSEEKVWALAWVEGAVIKPLVLVSPPGFFKQPALIHLVPGLPATPLGQECQTVATEGTEDTENEENPLCVLCALCG